MKMQANWEQKKVQTSRIKEWILVNENSNNFFDRPSKKIDVKSKTLFGYRARSVD